VIVEISRLSKVCQGKQQRVIAVARLAPLGALRTFGINGFLRPVTS
jgi:hypothetical protein